jgi:hypothetical protein
MAGWRYQKSSRSMLFPWKPSEVKLIDPLTLVTKETVDSYRENMKKEEDAVLGQNRKFLSFAALSGCRERGCE